VITDLIQPTHLLFILVVALLVLGPKRLPDVAKSLGKGLRDFRGALSGIEEHKSDLLSTATVHVPAPVPADPAAPTAVTAVPEVAPVTALDPLPAETAAPEVPAPPAPAA
jgi:TatA/E family protein of Tat protein translocase